MNIIEKYIRPVLELVYFVASIGLSATIFIGLKQLELVKDDIKIRNKRASVEKSIEYLHWFATEFIPQISEIATKVEEKFNFKYTGPMNKQFIFDVNCNPNNVEIANFFKVCADSGVLGLMNQLEYFSAALLSGLADEELAFNPLSDTYCRNVECYYIFICGHRKDANSRFYTNIIGLYDIWKGRLNKMELENQKRKIDENISRIEDKRIHSIGN